MNALATVASPPEAPVRVVLIDDSKIFLGIMFEYLSRLPGIEIVGFTTSVRDALRTLKALQPDLIVMDLIMPEMSGLEAAARVRRGALQPRIIIVSGMNESRIAEQCVRAGADAFIGKEDLAEALPRAVAQWFPRGRTAPSIDAAASTASMNAKSTR